MNAINFIKQHGVDKAREVVEGAPRNAVYYWQIPRCKHGVYSSLEQNQGRAIVLEELKRLVASVDLIKKHGGLFSTKCQLDKGGIHYEWYGENGDYGLTDLEDLAQAIADYELIYSNDTNIKNHVSPLCKVGVK